MQVIVVLIIILFFESFIEPGDKSLEYVLGWILGNIEFGSRNLFLASLVRFLIPQIGILFLWGNYLHENVVKNYELIFTRTRKSGKVLTKYVTELLMRVTGSVLFLEIGILIVYSMKGCTIDSMQNFLFELFIYCIYTVSLVLVVNMISLATKSIYGILIIFAVQLFQIEVMYHLLQNETVSKVYYLFPASAVMFTKNIQMGCNIKFGWILYLLGIMALCFLVGCRYTSYKEYY